MSETERPSGRHPVSIGHLVMGLAFVGLVGVWALVQGDVVDGSDVRWLLPIPWVVAGIAGLLATTLTSRNRWANRQTGWVVQPPAARTTAEPEDEHEPEDAEPTVPVETEDEDPGTDPNQEIR